MLKKFFAPIVAACVVALALPATAATAASVATNKRAQPAPKTNKAERAPKGKSAERAVKRKKAERVVTSRKSERATKAKMTERTKLARAAKKARTVTYEDITEGDSLTLRSSAVLVQDQSSGEVILEKNSGVVLPIASITKLMTAMVVLDAHQSLGETLTISEEDIDTLRGSRSRLAVGSELTREDMLRLALMSSENRAASALSRHYPGGAGAFVASMNRKADSLGLGGTHFLDATGLHAGNVSTARDLVKLVDAAARYPLIRELSTTPEHFVDVGGRILIFRNTNPLVSSEAWSIGVSKTGFINESGKCLVMQAWMNSKPMIIVLLDSSGRLTRVGDANRIKRWVEEAYHHQRQSS